VTMMRELNKIDMWLINEIKKELQKEYSITSGRALECIQNSNLIPMLTTDPDFVHHENSNSWVKIIAKQNDLRALVY